MYTKISMYRRHLARGTYILLLPLVVWLPWFLFFLLMITVAISITACSLNTDVITLLVRCILFCIMRHILVVRCPVLAPIFTHGFSDLLSLFFDPRLFWISSSSCMPLQHPLWWLVHVKSQRRHVHWNCIMNCPWAPHWQQRFSGFAWFRGLFSSQPQICVHSFWRPRPFHSLAMNLFA